MSSYELSDEAIKNVFELLLKTALARMIGAHKENQPTAMSWSNNL